MSNTYLCVIGERQALAWVLSNERMAFPITRRSEVDALAPGDDLLLLTTRGCFRNPTRDRTRIIGRASVLSSVRRTDEPMDLFGREFDRECEIEVESLVPALDGVEVVPLVDRLESFPKKHAWSIWLRRPLLRVTEADASLLGGRLAEVAGSRVDHLQGYLDRGVPPQRQ